MKNNNSIFILLLACLLAACGSKEKKSYDEMGMSGRTTRTENLRENLRTYADKGLMLGQMHATLEGVGWQCDSDRSDLRTISGDRPAVIGYEIGGIETGALNNARNISFNLIREDILKNFKRGALIILNWPGAAYQDNDDVLKEQAKALAKWLSSLQDGYGIKAPVVLNLYPLDRDAWYSALGKDDYDDLYEDMQELLEDADVTNVVYGYSEAYTPDGFLARCPDDDVDVVNAVVLQAKEQADSTAFAANLKAAIAKALPFAQEHGCAFGLTAGIESVPFANIFSGMLMPALKDHRISYLLLGGNHGDYKDGHFYAPYPGDGNDKIQDFMRLYNEGNVVMMKHLNGLYLKH